MKTNLFIKKQIYVFWKQICCLSTSICFQPICFRTFKIPQLMSQHMDMWDFTTHVWNFVTHVWNFTTHVKFHNTYVKLTYWHKNIFKIVKYLSRKFYVLFEITELYICADCSFDTTDGYLYCRNHTISTL